MHTAICFVTDAKGFELTEHAAAVAAITQETVKDIVIFCADFLPADATNLSKMGDELGKNIHIKYISSSGINSSAKKTGSHVTGTANLKIYALNELSSLYQRVLYIDGDVLLIKDIKLENIDFQENPIAAVYDIAEAGGITYPFFHQRCKETGRSPHYFNAGFIAVDFDKWDVEFIEKFEEASEKHKNSCDYKIDCKCQDQCVMNIVFEKNWTRLPLTFNFQASAMFTERWKYAAVRHYVGKKKFLPRKLHRNDSVDVALINRARAALGREGIGSPGHDWIVRLNRFRHRRQNRLINNAITTVEMMFSEDFDEPSAAEGTG